ncbi:hypothetical protein EC991_006143 [Linnemannia zychae]|nr:hypothetical protein EC991_006143 [Linnemannia zychae]
MATRVIPKYQHACLAADFTNNAVILVGVSESPLGQLQVNSVSLANITLPTVETIATTIATAWSSTAEKACYAASSSTQTNKAALKVVQFGTGMSYMSFISGNSIGDPLTFDTLKLESPKLFSWIGSFSAVNLDMFHMYAISPSSGTGSNWIGLRLNVGQSAGSLYNRVTGEYPKASNPLLSVGTYTPSNNNEVAQGYSIIFDRIGAGEVFATKGNSKADPNNTIPFLTLTLIGSVNMNGYKLTSNAISTTLEGTGYILDRAADGVSTVMYSITPNSALDLNLVPSSGPSIPFSTSIAAAGLYNTIVTYTSSNTGPAFINTFDLTTNRWSGAGLLPEVIPPKSSSIGPIVGGAAGGLLVIGAAVFFFVRRRRRRQAALKANDSTELAQLSPNTSKFGGGDQGYAQHDHGYVAYEQGYPQPPSFVPPPPIAGQYTDAAYKEPAFSEAGTPLASPTANSYSYVSPTSYRDSAYPSVGPESVLVKSNRSSTGHSPQYIASSPGASSNARSPQSVSS